MNNNFANEYVFVEQKLLQEKQTIRQRAMFIGIAMLIALAVQLFWSVLYFNVMRMFGFDSNAALEIAQQPIVMQLINQILSVLCFTLPFLVVASGCQLKLSEVANYGKPKKEYLLPTILISISFFSFGNIASSVFASILGTFGLAPTAPSISAPEGIFGFIVTFIGAAVVAPLTEEFAMRGVVLGALRKYGDGFAILVSALLFGLMHGNFVQIPFAFVVGLALGFAVVKTGSVWTGVIIHFINNASAVVIDSVGKYLPEEASLIVNLVYFCSCFVCLFIGILLLKGRSVDYTKLEGAKTDMRQRTAAWRFFTSPFIVVYIALIIINAIIGAL